jgi:hypothetical protein
VVRQKASAKAAGAAEIGVERLGLAGCDHPKRATIAVSTSFSKARTC